MPSQLFARKPLSLIHEEMNGDQRLRRVLGPVLGFGVYFGYGRKRSVMARLRQEQVSADATAAKV